MLREIDWKHLFTSIDGRINRQRWWAGVVVLFVVGLIAGSIFGDEGLIPFVIGVLIMFAGVCMHIKRCHDRDKSGWWCLLLLIPFIGTIWAIVDLGLLEGTKGTNRFGSDPLNA